jgi:hypothetical protein
MKNGYFGAAYWHPEHQQDVIAHRGTKLTNVGAIFSDINGVLFKHHVPQMSSVGQTLRAIHQFCSFVEQTLRAMY